MIIVKRMKREPRSEGRTLGQRAIQTMSLCLIAACLVGSLAFSAPLYPEPTGNINDYVGVLTESDLENLNTLVDSVLGQTGVTFAVAIVSGHGDESLEMYSANLYEKWGIGEKGKDMGLLVVLSIEEPEIRMEVGYGLEPVITDGRAGECLDKMLPYFRNEEYGEGLYNGLSHAAWYVAKDAGVELNLEGRLSEHEQPGVLPVSILPVFAVGFFAFSLFIYGLSRRNRCPKCKSRLVVTDKVIQQATFTSSGQALRMYRCPRCGYYREKRYKINRIIRPPGSGGVCPPSAGEGPFFGGFGGAGGSRGSKGGFSMPKGFGGGRSGGGGASRKW